MPSDRLVEQLTKDSDMWYRITLVYGAVIGVLMAALLFVVVRCG